MVNTYHLIRSDNNCPVSSTNQLVIDQNVQATESMQKEKIDKKKTS